MKLFLVKTDQIDWDEYDSHVVSADTSKEAINLAEAAGLGHNTGNVSVKYIGEYYLVKSEVIHSSYNAG